MFVASAFFLFQVCNDDDHENDDEKTVNRGLCSTLIGSATNRDTKEEHIQFKRMHEGSYTSHFGIIRYKVQEYLAIILDQILEKIDLFSLYVLFSSFRPRDAIRGNSFFQMSSYARANVRITNEKQKANSHEGITWSETGKQNTQAKEVYCQAHVLFQDMNFK